MCRGPKPFVSEDIYRLHEDNTVNNDDSFETATGPLENRSKGKSDVPLRIQTLMLVNNFSNHVFL